MNFPILTKNRKQIEEIQLKKIKALVKTAFEKSDFYRQYYVNSGFEPSQLKTYNDIEKIPVVKRIALKNAPVESILTNKDFSKLHLHTTSGSSGVPVKFYYTDIENRLKNYGVLRSYLMMGMKLTDKTIAFRDPIDIRKPSIFERIGILAYDYYNVFNPIKDSYNAICDKYSKIDLIKGMPSDMLNLCYEIRHGGKKFPKVRMLISDSEVLDEFSRKYIEETIGTKILDWYGSVECGCIAFQLPNSNKYFINEDQILLENRTPEQDQGDAIITNLNNSTFPIIRYQIGDVVNFGDGKSDLQNVNLRTIDGIQGKYLDFIVLPDKSIISPHVAKQEFTHLGGIKKFQIIQKDYDEIVMKIERDTDYTEETEKKVENAIERIFNGMVKLSIEYDDMLSQKSSYRKFKVIQSDVAQNFLSGK